MRIAHISDPHFGTEVAKVRDALLRELHDTPPDLVVVSGDITQRARRAQFRAARDFLAALPAVPRLCLPGNHDIPLFDVFTRLVRPYQRFKAHVSDELQPQFVDARCAVLCVDATSRLRHKDGALDEALIEATRARLAQHARPFRVVVTHQPLSSATESDRGNVAHGAGQALDQWIRAGADLFLGGHIHLPYCVTAWTLDRNRAAVLAQAGTCVSHRIRAGIPNSYNLIVLEHEASGRRIRVDRRDFDVQGGAFGLRRRHVARSDGSAFGWDLAEERLD